MGWLVLGAFEVPAILQAELEVGMPSLAMAWIILLLYAVLLAVPFVPSAEVGFAVMLALGSSMVVPVYAATVLGLTIAFVAGRHAHLYRRGNGAGDIGITSRQCLQNLRRAACQSTPSCSICPT